MVGFKGQGCQGPYDGSRYMWCPAVGTSWKAADTELPGTSPGVHSTAFPSRVFQLLLGSWEQIGPIWVQLSCPVVALDVTWRVFWRNILAQLVLCCESSGLLLYNYLMLWARSWAVLCCNEMEHAVVLQDDSWLIISSQLGIQWHAKCNVFRVDMTFWERVQLKLS